MHKFKSYVNSIITLNDEEWGYLSSKVSIASFSKGEMIHEVPNIPDRIMFINEGIARSFITEYNGKDLTWNFHFTGAEVTVSNLFVTDYSQFLQKNPAQLNCEALSDCEMFVITYDDLQKLYKNLEQWQKFGRVNAERAYCVTRHRALSLLTQSAEKRLQVLVKEYPSILDQVAHYHIASYLGITPQTLSRIKNDQNAN